MENVIYEGADENGYIAEIIGDARYLALTGETHVTPTVKPPLVHEDTDENTSAEDRVELKAENEERIEQWWSRTGWIEGTGHKIQETMDEKYHQQLGHKILN